MEEYDDSINTMSNMIKSHWVTDGNSMRLSLPFQKVDKENRLVSGYATLDNLDSQGDIVLAEASTDAFARAKGNIREMHQPIAAGHLVDFREDEYYDTKTTKFYRGIYVTAYVSKGAESTWEKVLDGTLTGFSIGGNIIEATNEFVKEADATIRFIKKYDLIELSLVDNPANQLANVFSIQKASDGSVTKMTGMITETKIENIFWCETDNVARTLDSESASCVNCGSQMLNIGWVENGEQREEKVREVVTKYLNRNQDSAVDDAISEGGVDVSKFEKSETAVAETEVVAVDEQNPQDNEENATVVDPAEKNVGETVNAEGEEVVPGEEVANVDEVEDEQEAISKKLDTLQETIEKSLTETRQATETAVAELTIKVDSVKAEFDEKTSELSKQFEEFSKDLATAKSAAAEIEKSLETLNSADAIKKSAEAEPEAVTKQKENLWGGAFSVKDLVR